MSKRSKPEDGLLFVLSSDESDKNNNEEVVLEFVTTKDNKIIVKQNNMITEVVKSDSDDYLTITDILESIEDDKNKS